MKTESTLGDKEKWDLLEKARHRAENLFAVAIGTMILPGVALVNSVNGPYEDLYAASVIASVPVVYTAWLNSMSKKTEEYVRLRNKYGSS